MTPSDLWTFLPFGYLLTVAIEAPILAIGLSRRHRPRDRIFAGFWLTACTYPIVVLVMPLLIPDSRFYYLLVAETFAPLAECALFWIAFGDKERTSMWRDFAVIVVANLASFGLGEALWWYLGG
jgi:hypothetical protein